MQERCRRVVSINQKDNLAAVLLILVYFFDFFFDFAFATFFFVTAFFAVGFDFFTGNLSNSSTMRLSTSIVTVSQYMSTPSGNRRVLASHAKCYKLWFAPSGRIL